MGKERIFGIIKKKNPRASGFIHIGEIIPGILKDIEKRVKDKGNSEALLISEAFLKNK